MVNVNSGWLKSANGLVMLLNMVAAVCAIIFWSWQYSYSDMTGKQIYYLCACCVALAIVAIVFFLTLFSKLTKRVLAIVSLIIAAVLVIIAIIVAVQEYGKTNRQLSLLSAAVLAGGLLASILYTGVGGLTVTT